MKFGNYWGTGGSVTPPEPPAPTVPSDMDFIYFADNFDGTKITNVAPNSTFGDYLKAGTITKNGSGSSCYLTNGLSYGNYLYKDITSAELDKFKAINTTYTYFIRVMQTNSGYMGGIVSFRTSASNGTYIYMIRAYNNQLQLHTTTGYNCGSNFSLTTDRVYKVVINGASFNAYNLDNDANYSLTYSTNRVMGNKLMSFNACIGESTESKLARFYALAGIPRATTAEEDEIIKTAMMNQSLTGDLNA
jgi:hypothetical protein